MRFAPDLDEDARQSAASLPELIVRPSDVDESPVLFLADGTALVWRRPTFGFCLPE